MFRTGKRIFRQCAMRVQNKGRLLVKLIALTLLWAVVWLFLHGERYQPWLEHRFAPATAFIVGIVLAFVATALFEVVFLFLLVKHQEVSDFRQFFKIERLDLPGIWLTLGLGIILQVINAAFLWRSVLEPARNYLLALGIPGAKIGLGTGEIVPALSPAQALFLTVFLILFWWLEAPEELFFRGYLQNQLQPIIGKNPAVILSALLWALAHVWGLANTVERFLYGFVYALVFRMRQNTTGPMICHPIANRALLLGYILPQIFGKLPACARLFNLAPAPGFVRRFAAVGDNRLASIAVR